MICVVLHTSDIYVAGTTFAIISGHKLGGAMDEYQQWIAATIAKAPKLSHRQIAEARLIIHSPLEIDSSESSGPTPAPPHRVGDDGAKHSDERPLAV